MCCLTSQAEAASRR